MLFLFGRHKKTLFWVSTVIVVLWLFLHVRRVEVFGIGILLVLWAKYRISQRKLFFLFGFFILCQAAIGMVRDFAIIEYFGDETTHSALHQERAALPGGASNVFLSGLHLVKVRDNNLVSETERFTMAEWPRSVVPNVIWEAFGAKAVRTEHELSLIHI